MKNILFVFAFLIAQCVAAQEAPSPEDKNKVYTPETVDVKPEFVGGMRAFYSFIAKNYRAPEKEGLNGRVIVTFIVQEDGSLSDFDLLEDIGYDTGEEALRVLALCPKWNPAMIGGKAVRCQYKFPIHIETAK